MQRRHGRATTAAANRRLRAVYGLKIRKITQLFEQSGLMGGG